MKKETQVRPLNVALRRGSSAERAFHRRTGHPLSEVIAPGLKPSPAHDLIFHGGKTIADLHFMNFYVGSDVWAADDTSNIDERLAAAMSDANLNNVMEQYFPRSISSIFDGSEKLAGPAPALVSRGDLESLITQLASEGKFAAHDLTSMVFNFLLPRGTVLNDDAAATGLLKSDLAAAPQSPIPDDDEEDSLHGLGGYHGSVHDKSGTIYYAVGVYSELREDGTQNGIPFFDMPWKNVVATFYHELNEARTDSDVEDAIRAGNDPNATQFLGWTSSQGEECGDFPVFEAGTDLSKVFQEVPLAPGAGTVPVQFQYSNNVHGPEGPRTTPAKKSPR